MLKISFLVTFCGLLARMAQAQTPIPCNQIPVAISNECFSNPVAVGVPKEYIAPNPPPVNDPATGAQFNNLTPTSPTDVSCKVTTQENGGPIMITINGNTNYSGQVTSPGSMKGVDCQVSNSVTVPFQVTRTSDGHIECKPPSSPAEAQVTCSTKPAPGGLLSGLLGAVLGILDGLLKGLNDALKGLLESTVSSLLNSVGDSLNAIFKKITASKPMGDNRICQQKVMTVTTAPNNCLNMVMETTKYTEDGKLIPPPGETYTPPELQPKPNSWCTWVLNEQLISNAMGNYNTPIQVTGAALASLSAQIQALCGNGATIEKLVFTPNGPPKVVITQDKVSATITGKLEGFVTGKSSATFIATATLTFNGTFNYMNPCVMISLMADSLSNVQLVTGPTSCDMTGPVCQAFINGAKGNTPIKLPVEASPIANLNLPGSTTFTNGEGHVVCNHQM